MCSACEFKAAMVPPGHPAASAERARDLDRQVRVLSEVLSGYGLRLKALPGSRFAVTTLLGATAHADGPESVWAAAERLIGQPIDPLDPRNLALA